MENRDIGGCMAHLGRFIQGELGKEKAQGVLDGEHNLIESGIIESVGIHKVVDFLESRFSIHIKDEELTPDNFKSLKSIESFIKRKIG